MRENLTVGQVFIFKLGCFTPSQRKCTACTQPFLKLKTQPRFCPVSLSLSMNDHAALCNRSRTGCLTFLIVYTQLLMMIAPRAALSDRSNYA